MKEGCQQSKSDYSLFTLKNGHEFTALLVYVDDVILARTSLNEFKRIRHRRLICRLLYLNTTRSDITFATQQLSQFLHTPTVTHYNAACRVVRYLKHNPGRGLLFPRNYEVQILGYSDSCIDSRKSISGFFFIGSSLISWCAKKQQTVSRSSSEAEYRNISTATCELQ